MSFHFGKKRGWYGLIPTAKTSLTYHQGCPIGNSNVWPQRWRICWAGSGPLKSPVSWSRCAKTSSNSWHQVRASPRKSFKWSGARKMEEIWMIFNLPLVCISGSASRSLSSQAYPKKERCVESWKAPSWLLARSQQSGDQGKCASTSDAAWSSTHRGNATSHWTKKMEIAVIW